MRHIKYATVSVCGSVWVKNDKTLLRHHQTPLCEYAHIDTCDVSTYYVDTYYIYIYIDIPELIKVLR
jgi:hypothetical protein